MPFTLSDLRQMWRHPERHPRNAVELGQSAGLHVATALFREGLGDDEQLAEWLESMADNLPPLDPLLEPHFSLWRQLFVAVTIREGVRRRFGSKAIVGFDTTADKIQNLERELAAQGLSSPINQMEQTLSWWFAQFDAMMVKSRARPWRAVDAQLAQMGITPRLIEGGYFCEAFCWVALDEDPASPVFQQPTDPRRAEFLKALLQNLSWLSPVADGLGWMMIKDAIRSVMDVDGELQRRGEELKQMLREALEEGEEGEEWKGDSGSTASAPPFPPESVD